MGGTLLAKGAATYPIVMNGKLAMPICPKSLDFLVLPEKIRGGTVLYRQNQPYVTLLDTALLAGHLASIGALSLEGAQARLEDFCERLVDAVVDWSYGIDTKNLLWGMQLHADHTREVVVMPVTCKALDWLVQEIAKCYCVELPQPFAYVTLYSLSDREISIPSPEHTKPLRKVLIGAAGALICHGARSNSPKAFWQEAKSIPLSYAPNVR